MDKDFKLLEQIGQTETKCAKLTLGWRGATTRLPDVTFVEEVAAPARRLLQLPPAGGCCASIRGRSRTRSTCAWNSGRRGWPATATAT